MNDPIVHAVMYRNDQMGTLCDSRAWGTPSLFTAITEDVTCPGCRKKLEGHRAVAQTPADENLPYVQIVVTYLTHQTAFFPVPPDEGWKISASMRCIVVGHGVPRTLIPLDTVLWFSLEEINR
jgi:hypothetical protein